MQWLQRLPLQIALRFGLSRKSERFVSFITGVSVAAVALGVMALVVVTSVVNGFERELIQVITGMKGEVILYTKGVPVSEQEDVPQRIRSIAPEVDTIVPSVLTEILASGPKGVTGALIEGVSLADLSKVGRLSEHIQKGRLPDAPREVVLGHSLAHKLGVKVGDELRLIAPFGGEDRSEDESVGFASLALPKASQFRVVGIFAMGLYEYDARSIVGELDSIREFLKLEGRYNFFKMSLKSKSSPSLVSRKLAESFGYPYRAKYWGEINENLFLAIAHERIVILLVLSAIMGVAAFNVLSTLMMMILEKGKEVAVLKTMGLTRRSVFSIFVAIGVSIGTVGTGLGLLGAFFVNRALELSGVVDLPAEIYSIDHLPILESPSDMAWISVFSISLCLLATLYPALSVAKRTPLEGLRYES